MTREKRGKGLGRSSVSRVNLQDHEVNDVLCAIAEALEDYACELRVRGAPAMAQALADFDASWQHIADNCLIPEITRLLVPKSSPAKRAAKGGKQGT